MRVPLVGGAYQARSVIAGSQRCINLIPEHAPQTSGEPSPVAHYPTPGLVELANYGTGPVRCLYNSTGNALIGIFGKDIVRVNADWTFSLIGTIADGFGGLDGMVSMVDDGSQVLVAYGGSIGYAFSPADGSGFGAFGGGGGPFYGADRADLLDGFFCANRPGTNQFYISNNGELVFDPLYIVKKLSGDHIQGVVVAQRHLWVLGERTTEIWTDAGASDFPLQIIGGGIDHGCAAKYSICRLDEAVLWLSRDKDGHAVVVMGSGYTAKRVSTHAIEQTLQGYPRIDDAIGWTYQIGGHAIYVLTFPAGNATWCFDVITGEWHQWQAADGGRHRGQCHAFAYGKHVVGDYATGKIYELRPDAYTDAGQRVTRVRSFPHMVSDGRRVLYRQLLADMQTGTAASGDQEPQLTLRWSDDRGATWGDPVAIGMGASGAALTSLQFQRLGMARDRVFELSWDAPVPTALMGAWIEATVARS